MWVEEACLKRIDVNKEYIIALYSYRNVMYNFTTVTEGESIIKFKISM